MNGRSYQPRFLFSYPNAKVGVMGSEQLAGVMEIIQRAAAKKTGIPYDAEQAEMLNKCLSWKQNPNLRLGIRLPNSGMMACSTHAKLAIFWVFHWQSSIISR